MTHGLRCYQCTATGKICRWHYSAACDAVKHEQNVCFVAADLVYTYLSLGYRNPVTDVAFHPFENMVAFCSYGESHLIKIFTYDHKGNTIQHLLSNLSVLAAISKGM